MSSLPETTRSLMEVFNGKLQDFTNAIDNVHMVWLEEIQQEAHRMFSSDFSTEPELMPKTPSQKKTNRRKRVSMELNESRSKRRFSKGKRSNLRRSSVQMTLITVSELVTPHVPSDSSESLMEEPSHRTRRNKTTAPTETDPVKRSTRNKGGAKAKDVEEVAESMSDVNEPIEVQDSSSNQDQNLVSEAVVKIPSSERLSADLLLNAGVSPGRSANKIPIAAFGLQTTPQGSSRTSARRSLVVRRSLVGLRQSMTQEAVRRASRRSFLKKKARLGNSTCSSSVSEDICMDVETEEMENKEEQADAPQMVTEPAAETKPEPEIVQTEELEPEKTEEMKSKVKDELPEETAESSTTENHRYTRSMARTSETDGARSKGDDRPSCSGSKRHAAQESTTPKKKQSPPKKCLTSTAPHIRSFLQTVQKNQMLMTTPGSLGRSTIIKSFIKQSATKTDTKLGSGSVERERQKWDALNKKIEQENERKKKIEEERRKKQEEMKRKRDERLKRVVEARVKGEKEKEQQKKKKIEEKLAQLEKKNDMLRVERLAEEKAKRKVATKRQEELELRKKQEEAARQKKLQQVEEEERRHQEMLAKRKAEEEREKARKLAEATRALELKKEQEREKEREQERERERERERQAAAEKERLEREKAIALQKELERAAREKERMEMEKRKMEEQRKAEEEREAQQKRVAAASAPAPPTVTAQVSAAKTQANILNTTITKSSALNKTVDIENSVLNTPVGKGAAHNKTVDLGPGLNVTMDIEQSPQSYQITPKGQKVNVLVNPEDYGMDQNSDDSTDDESAPKKPIPSWAEGMQLQQAVMKQYYNPLDLHAHFGEPEPPKLEEIFRRTKPRFFKRTSSAVWHSPPRLGNLDN
ncbi:inner centromere protein isoform X1 [Cyprinus carpio]|nr:inner centromere protein isoform X1 [Cyprinus carpio]XP_042608938.1 inner centromere protein isoform X1 [Cyprinus carpio]XP_042608939.1 inner centromere protein isoform X1 [Cyprinus carpio]XP_042608940.1 inner centromere protein isoform X1 [Cyprinus carpio]